MMITARTTGVAVWIKKKFYRAMNDYQIFKFLLYSQSIHIDRQQNILFIYFFHPCTAQKFASSYCLNDNWAQGWYYARNHEQETLMLFFLSWSIQQHPLFFSVIIIKDASYWCQHDLHQPSHLTLANVVSMHSILTATITILCRHCSFLVFVFFIDDSLFPSLFVCVFVVALRLFTLK